MGNKQKIFRRTGETYMTSETAKRVMPLLIEGMEQATNAQSDVNDCYTQLVSFILNEAEDANCTNHRKRKQTKYKPYWDNALAKSWKNLSE